MSQWNPEQYLRFEQERTRPARELLARAEPAASPTTVVDLGCGPGNSTELLARRFPSSTLIGVDNSDAMLTSARARLPGCRFELLDIAGWHPDGAPPDVIFANAALQWVDDHCSLIPRLFAALAPGGVLAIQMPDNRDEPTHRLMRELAAMAPWSAPIAEAGVRRTEILPLEAYYDLLAPQAEAVDVWRTAYQHPMPDAASIVDWVRSTGLRPFVDPLPAALQASYLEAYRQRIDLAYPPRADGQRLLAFPRLFIVARRGHA